MNCEKCSRELNATFKIGQIVSHKTNGLKMVIMKIHLGKDYCNDPIPAYTCKYQILDGYWRDDTFSEFELEIKN